MRTAPYGSKGRGRVTKKRKAAIKKAKNFYIPKRGER